MKSFVYYNCQDAMCELDQGEPGQSPRCGDTMLTSMYELDQGKTILDLMIPRDTSTK